MSAKQSVFLLGPGYIGLQVLNNLIAAGHPTTVLMRSKERGAELEKKGIKVVLGSIEDTEVIAPQAAQHEIIINTSSSDDIPSVVAILDGVRQRAAQNLPTTFIQTSGIAALIDSAKGAYKNDLVYSDDDPSTIDALPPTAIHRDVDLTILEASRELGAKANIAIIIPPIVYGVNPEHKRPSMGFPPMVRFALKRGYAGRIGEGKNVWSGVHIADLARAYLLLVEKLDSVTPSVQENPYFFADNGEEFAMGDIVAHIGRVLHKLGKIDSPEVKVVKPEHSGDMYDPFVENVVGSNTRHRSVRLPQLGWVPREKSVWDALEEEDIPCLLEMEG